MKTAIFEVFRVGKHNGNEVGRKIYWDNDQLASIQRFYSEQTRPAPLVIGHPKDNLPEYGTVKRLIHHNGALFAEAEVSSSLLKRIKAGDFSGISASFIPPNNKQNPTKDLSHYLNHVGFLEKGMNPAVKGMKAPAESVEHLNFSETDGILYYCEADDRPSIADTLNGKIHYLQNALDVDFATAFQLLTE